MRYLAAVIQRWVHIHFLHVLDTLLALSITMSQEGRFNTKIPFEISLQIADQLSVQDLLNAGSASKFFTHGIFQRDHIEICLY